MTHLKSLPQGSLLQVFQRWSELFKLLRCFFREVLLTMMTSSPVWREPGSKGKIRFIGASAYGEEIPMKVMNREAFRTLKRLHEEIGSVIACNFDPCRMWY